MDEFGAFLDELRHDADGDFLHALRFDLDADGTGDAFELLGGGDFFVAEMFEDDAGLARAADHAEEQKWFVDPVRKHERIVPMTARDDEREGRDFRRREREEFFPDIRLKINGVWKILVVSERGAVIEYCYVEIELQRERGDGLGNVAGASDPEFAGRRDGFGIKKCGVRSAECGIGN